MTARKLLVGLGLALLATGMLAPPASAAAPTVASDPAGDGHGSGDVLALKVYQSGGEVTFQVRTPRSVSLHSPAWTFPSSTQLRFNFAYDSDTQVDTAIVITAGAGGAEAEFVHFDFAPRIECKVGVFKPQPDIIRVTMIADCLNADSIRTFARYRFDQGGNGSIDSDDRAPNVGRGPSTAILHP